MLEKKNISLKQLKRSSKKDKKDYIVEGKK